MSDVGSVTNSVEPEAVTSAMLNPGKRDNQSGNQSFSKSFADSLERHSQPVERLQSHFHTHKSKSSVVQAKKQEAGLSRMGWNSQENSQCIESNATGRSLPGNGKGLHQGKGDEESQALSNEINAAGMQAIEVDVSGMSRPENTVVAFVPGLATATTTTDAATLVDSVNGNSKNMMPEQQTLQSIRGTKNNLISNLSGQAGIAGGEAGVGNNNETAQALNNPTVDIPGLHQQQTSKTAGFKVNNPSTPTLSQNWLSQGAPAQTVDKAPKLTSSISDQIKQCITVRLNHGQTNNNMQGLGNQAHDIYGNSSLKAVSLSSAALNVDDSHRLNHHLLFEKLLTHPGLSSTRGTTANTNYALLNTGTQQPDSVAQELQSTVTDNASNLVVSAMDMRPTSAANGNSIMPTVSVPLPVHNPAWAQDVGHKLIYMLNHDMPQAQLQMNPRHLGPLEVRISLGHDQQVNVSFVTHNMTARDAIDGAIPRLREMLAQQGLSLSDFNVSQENFKSPQDQTSAQAGTSSHGFEAPDINDELALDGMAPVQTTTIIRDRIVDYFA